MDWSQIVSLVSNIVLAFFTIILAGATVALWRSTSRYADVSERLLEAEKDSFMVRMFDLMHHAHVARLTEIRGVFSQDVVDEVGSVCKRITEELLKEFGEEDPGG